jgi:hypothetical protein
MSHHHLLLLRFLMEVKTAVAKLGCGNVGISRCLRDSQGAVERVGKLFLLFHSFHGPGISTALSGPHHPSLGRCIAIAV